MAMNPKKGPPEAFDEAKLLELSEPITVTVQKMINGRPCPIQLPVKPNEEIGGKGWTADEVRQLDDLLANHLSGGGTYYNTATGSNGAQMRWQSYYPLDKYPEKMTVVAASGNGHAPAPVQLSGVAVSPPAPVQPMASWMQYGQPTVAVSPPQPTFFPSLATPLSRDQGEALRQEREARIQLEARMERQQLEAGYREQLAAINQEIRRMQETTQARPVGDSPEIVALKAQLEAMKQAQENDKVTAMIRELQQSTQAQLAAQQQSMQQAITALTTLIQQKPTGPDPFMMMMLESQKAQAQAQLEIAKLQAEAQKESARLQAEAARESARNAIGPREMVDLASKLNSGGEHLAAQYTRLLEVSQQTFENMLNAQGPQVHPAVEMAANGIQGVLGVAQRYIEAKESATTNQARAAAAVAQAQAQAQVAVAQSGGALASAPTAVIDAPAAAAEGDDDDEGEEDEVSEEETEELEKQLFGDARVAVNRLRAGVGSGVVTPEQAASALLQGIDHFVSQGKQVQAFVLWQQGELHKLVQILIPDAPTSFQEQMIAVLFATRQQMK